MPVERDQIVVVDIEATCWEPDATPPGQINEIIEIGVCLVAVETYEITQKMSLLVTPTASTISPFCTRLTSLTPEMIEEGGIPFVTACRILETTFNTPNRLWGSWGLYDRTMFQQQCARMGVRYPFSDRHMNIKSLFARTITRRERVGMETALQLLDLRLEGRHHRGVDDAWNIARILSTILKYHTPSVLKRYW